MDDLINDMMLKGLIAIIREPRSETLVELIRSTKAIRHMDAIEWLDCLRWYKN